MKYVDYEECITDFAIRHCIEFIDEMPSDPPLTKDRIIELLKAKLK